VQDTLKEIFLMERPSLHVKSRAGNSDETDEKYPAYTQLKKARSKPKNVQGTVVPPDPSPRSIFAAMTVAGVLTACCVLGSGIPRTPRKSGSRISVRGPTARPLPSA